MNDNKLLDVITDPLQKLGCSECGGGPADSHLEVSGAQNHIGGHLARLCGEIKQLHRR